MSAGVHIGSPDERFRGVVIGASLGGLPALSQVLGPLPPTFPAPLLVIQHGAGQRLVEILGRQLTLAVRAAADGAVIGARGVTVIPPGVGIVASGAGPPEFRSEAAADHPVDRAFTVLAQAFGRALIAVVLTGKLDDGAAGVRVVKRAGGRVLVEDPRTALAPAMPSAAMATGCVDFVLPLARIAAGLIALAMAPGAADLLTVPPPSWATL